MIEIEHLQLIQDLHARYNRALDRHDMRAWADCFGIEASYVCTTQENEARNLPLAIMMDDSRERLEDRITYINKIWAGTFEDYTTRHFVERPQCRPAGPDRYEVESSFLVAYTSSRGTSELLTTGTYFDQIEIAGDQALLRARKAVLDCPTTPRYLVYPI